MKKNDALKNALLIVALIILVFFLFLPPMLRWLVKPVEKEEIKKVITILSCTKAGEKVNTSYVNEDINLIYYVMDGKYQDKNSLIDDTDDKPITNVKENEIADDLAEYAIINYDEENNTTSFDVNFDGDVNLPSYSQSILYQMSYYENKGFSCTQNSQ